MGEVSLENFARHIKGKCITDIVKVDPCTIEIYINSHYVLKLYDPECSFGIGGGFGNYPIELSKNVGIEITDVELDGDCLMILSFENGEKACIPWSAYEARVIE